MKKFLKVASIVLVIAMIACFAACGGNGGDDTFKIGVQTNTTGDLYSTWDFGEDAVVRYDNGALAVEALKTGKVDIVIIDNEPAKAYVAANEGLKILETEYAVEEYAICFAKDNDDLKKDVDGALKALIKDGSVAEIVDKYINGGDGEKVGVPVTAEDTDKPDLVMATNAEFPPYEYIDGDNYYGIDVEVAKIIADKLGYDLVIKNVAFDSIIPGVQAGKYDMGMAGMTVTDERLEKVAFSTSYATGVQSVIVKDGGAVASLDDIAGKKIGVQTSTTGDIYASDEFGDDAVVKYDNGAAAVQGLLAGKVDCVIIDNEPAKSYVAANEGLSILDTEYAVEDYAICFAKENTELQTAVDEALKALIADGKVAEVVSKYIKAE